VNYSEDISTRQTLTNKIRYKIFVGNLFPTNILRGRFCLNNIKELARRVTKEIQQAGYYPTTIWMLFLKTLP